MNILCVCVWDLLHFSARTLVFGEKEQILIKIKIKTSNYTIHMPKNSPSLSLSLSLWGRRAFSSAGPNVPSPPDTP